MSSMVRKPLILIGLVASMAAAAGYQAGYAPSAPVAAKGMPRPAPADPAIGVAVTEWNRLRQSDRLPFADYAAFLLAHPGWPGEAAMRRATEKAIRPDTDDPARIVALFDRMPPLTGAGRVRQAEALAALGRTGAARDAARAAWTGGVLSAEDEALLLARHAAAFTPADQDARMEALLWARAPQAAGRQIDRVSAARRPVYAARLAMQRRDADAMTLSDAVRPQADRDPGFEMDRAVWLRDTAQSPAARAYLARAVRYDAPPYNPEAWMEGMLAMARAAAADGQYGLSYAIAARLDSAFPAGTDVRARTAGERDDYTSLAWLAGTTALKRLGRPADAVGLFTRYTAAAKSPSSQTKGQYWAGRAAEAAGQGRANAHMAAAATHYDQFYGQLAAERLGRALPVPAIPAAVTIPPAAQAAFDRDEMVRAARWLGANGTWGDQTQFVRAIAAGLKSDTDHLLAARLAEDLARPDLGVLVARAARMDGSTDYAAFGFPQVEVPGAMTGHWVMIHAIARQESQFDREAVSSAGARGLMQLMGPTAKQVAGQVGLPWEPGRLVTDPSYNIMLGSTYFAGLLRRYDGNHVLAVAAYNAGPGNVNRFIRANGDPRSPGVDVVDWIEAIPLSETRGYVQRVLENAVVYDLMNPSRARLAAVAGNRLSAYLGRTAAG